MASMPDPSAPREHAAADRRRELGAFLRSRRARLRPETVGLVDWGVRRVPGLRRDEVAQLANVGLTWYTWLEQGRDVRPSVSVLSAIADALRLDPYEREHLFALAREPEGTGCRGQPSAAPELGRLVAGLEPTPAYAISSRFDVLAHNRAAGLLFGDLEPGSSGPANMMRRAFINSAWRELIVDWEQEAARHVAMYRAAMTLHLDEHEWSELPEELAKQSADFARHWSRSDVAGPERRLKRFRHPLVGQLTLHSTSLLMADDAMIRLVILHPSSRVGRRKARPARGQPSIGHLTAAA